MLEPIPGRCQWTTIVKFGGSQKLYADFHLNISWQIVVLNNLIQKGLNFHQTEEVRNKTGCLAISFF